MTGILLVGIPGLVVQLGFMTTGYDWVVWADVASWVGNPPATSSSYHSLLIIQIIQWPNRQTTTIIFL